MAAFRTAVLAACACAALLSGCGDDPATTSAAGSTTATSSSPASPAAPSSASAEVAAFCTDAKQVFGELSSASDDVSALPALVDQAVGAFDSITPPAEVQADWTTLRDALQRLSDTVHRADLNTTTGQQKVEQEVSALSDQVSTAETSVQQYVTDNCPS